MDIYGGDDSIYGRFLNANPPTEIATTANPPTAQTETPVSARFDDDFSGLLPEVVEVEVVDAVDEDPEVKEEPVDGVVGVVGVVGVTVPPALPGTTG